jgi:hypothetical protein
VWTLIKHAEPGIERHLRRCLDRRRPLRAWGAPLPVIELTIVRCPQRHTTGWAVRPNQITLRVGRDVGEAEAILLHELAHLAAWHAGGPNQWAWSFHGRRWPWRRFYLAAAQEIAREVKDRATYHDLDRAVAASLRRQVARRA